MQADHQYFIVNTIKHHFPPSPKSWLKVVVLPWGGGFGWVGVVALFWGWTGPTGLVEVPGCLFWGCPVDEVAQMSAKLLSWVGPFGGGRFDGGWTGTFCLGVTLVGCVFWVGTFVPNILNKSIFPGFVAGWDGWVGWDPWEGPLLGAWFCGLVVPWLGGTGWVGCWGFVFGGWGCTCVGGCGGLVGVCFFWSSACFLFV